MSEYNEAMRDMRGALRHFMHQLTTNGPTPKLRRELKEFSDLVDNCDCQSKPKRKKAESDFGQTVDWLNRQFASPYQLTENEQADVLDLEAERLGYDPMTRNRANQERSRLEFPEAEASDIDTYSAYVLNTVDQDQVLDLEAMPHRRR